MRILVIEDDEALGAQIVEHLQGAGYETEWIRDGDEARKAEIERFQMIVLDLMLPGTYGLDLLKLYRERSDVPVLILSARQDTNDKVRALKLGADDYVTKPFWPEELLARVRARLRRPDIRRGEGPMKVGALMIDLEGRTLKVNGAEVELTRAEMDILAALAKRPDSAMTRRALVEAALEQGTERTLDVHVSRLRKKLGDAGKQIVTVWGIGYKLVAEP